MAFLGDLNVNNTLEKISSLTNFVEKELHQKIALQITSLSPILLSAALATLFIFLSQSFFRHFSKDRKLQAPFIFTGTLFIVSFPYLISNLDIAPLLRALLFAFAYMALFSPIMQKFITESKSLWNPFTIVVISFVRVALFSLAIIIILSSCFWVFLKNKYHFTNLMPWITLLSQVHLWIFMNLILGLLWSLPSAWNKHKIFKVFSRIPYFVFALLLSVASAIVLFRSWLPHLSNEALLASIAISLVMSSIVLFSNIAKVILYFSTKIANRFFSEVLRNLFPIEGALRVFSFLIIFVVAGNAIEAFFLQANEPIPLLKTVESILLRISFAQFVLVLFARISKKVHTYLDTHARQVKRVGNNRRLLSLSSFAQSIVPFSLNLISWLFFFTILGVPFYYLAVIITVFLLLVAFVGRKILEDISQGFLHTLFGAHLAVGDLIELEQPQKVVGFIENLTLYNVTIRVRSTGALKVVPFSDLRSFIHHDRGKARILALLQIPHHVLWVDIEKCIDSALYQLKTHPESGQYFLDDITLETENLTTDYLEVRVGFNTVVGDARQFIMRRSFLTYLKQEFDKTGISLAPKIRIEK
ncbi:MAG: mechanosensitive ion channel [Alphaproteobacteria bacterium]|nr:mechanosensitive ion channel [Alphaproteobacteria bacterium]